MNEIPDEDLNTWLTILANSDEMQQSKPWYLRAYLKDREQIHDGLNTDISKNTKAEKVDAERMRQRCGCGWNSIHKAELLGASQPKAVTFEQVLDEFAHFDYMTERNFGNAERAEVPLRSSMP